MKRSNIVLILILILLVILSVIALGDSTMSLGSYIATLFLGILGGISAIAEITGLFDRLGLPERIEPSYRRFANHVSNPLRTNVALWGPVGSGKTWLIKAFAKTLLTQYEISPNNNLQYDFLCMNYEFAANLATPTKATDRIYDSVFRFERKPTSTDYASHMSAFTHEIFVFDHMGGISEKIAQDSTSQYYQDTHAFHQTVLNITNADILLIALDPSSERIGLRHSESSDWKQHYADMVDRIISIVEKANNKNTFYAICVTKTDQIQGAAYIAPEALVELYFGKEMMNVLTKYQHKRIQVFSTSAFGYLESSKQPNYDWDTGVLRDEQKWKPYGVEYPFFWSFESVEQIRLEKEIGQRRFDKLVNRAWNHKYIGYPEPNYDSYFS